MNTVKTFLIALCLTTAQSSLSKSCNSNYIEVSKAETVFAGVPETAQKSWGELANQLIAVIWDCKLDEDVRIKKMKTITEMMGKLENIRCHCEPEVIVKPPTNKNPLESDVKGVSEK